MTTSSLELVYLCSTNIDGTMTEIYIMIPYSVIVYRGGSSHTIDYRPIGEQQCK